MSRPSLKKMLILTLVASSCGLSEGSARTNIGAIVPKPKQTAIFQRATTASLGGPERYLTLLSTDKPIYRSGEKVYVRGVLLNALNHKPLPRGKEERASVQIKGPKGDIVGSGTALTGESSTWGFLWEVPAGQPGGLYSVRVLYPFDGLCPAVRNFEIREYRVPRLSSQITFLRDGYGPGQKVTATLEVKRAEGGIPRGARVEATATIDGAALKGSATTVDERGICTVTLDLPRKIVRGDGTLALTIEDGGVVETASKSIPILLQSVDLQILPEGGDLLAGYKNRVYIQAKQPNGKPADITGTLMNKAGRILTTFRTEHEGRGRFQFVPKADTTYYLKVSKPDGIKTIYPLPPARKRGAVILASQDIYKKGEPVTFKVGCTDKTCIAVLSRRELKVGEHKIRRGSVKRGFMTDVSFNLRHDVDGVLTFTVFDQNGMPLAERLVFRQPEKSINLSITSDKKKYVPGEQAKLTIKATDDNGRPVATTIGVTVSDDSVLEMVEKREKAPRLPVMFFLEPEVKDLADAQVYLDAKNPRAPMATDLLLGTQGWRRFGLVDVNEFLKTQGEAASRVVALKSSIVDPYQHLSGNQDETKSFVTMPLSKQAENSGSRRPFIANNKRFLALPQEIGRIEGPRDMNLFQVEPSVIDERHYSTGRAERHQKTSPTLPAGAPVPDGVEKFTFFQDRTRSVSPGYAIVRQFAHETRPDRKPTDRVDFTETLYWNAGVKTAPDTGEATISFALNDSVTTFRAIVDGFSDNGAIGTANAKIESVQPFYTEAKLPLEVTSGDKILLPINLVNVTQETLGNAKTSIDLSGNFKFLDLQKTMTAIASGARLRWIQPIDVGIGNGQSDLVLTAKAGPYEDKVTRKISVKPNGFPTEVAFGGVLEPGKSISHTIAIPSEIAQGSLESTAILYPTPLANMTGALERLIQDPNGCFEQTCATSYPLTMAQQYFLSHANVAPSLIETSKHKLDAGYTKLVSFWCPDRGYEWFGQNPGHEALTAFGLLHFTDMEQVREVDKDMLKTTRAWLMKQKDGMGGFNRKRRALHTWIEDKDCSNAYIVWALLECGEPSESLKPELTSLRRAAESSGNTYVKALAANAFWLAGDKSEAKKLMDVLVAKQKPDGSLDDIKSSIVGSGGESLAVEGTSLATLSWLRDPEYAQSVEKSIKFLAESCKAGRYGSTQSTVLALRAIIAYDKLRAHVRAAGKVRAYIDGQPIGDWVSFDQSTQEEIKLPDLLKDLSSGEHKLELKMDGGSPMPYSVAIKYNALTPISDSGCKLNLAVSLTRDKVVEGESTQARVVVANRSKEVVPNPVAIIGLPGGLEPRQDQLKELVKTGRVDAYQIMGREVVLYWRAIDQKAKFELPLSLIAAVPGSYTGPASRAYLYYDDESKKWQRGMHVEIAPKQPASPNTALLPSRSGSGPKF